MYALRGVDSLYKQHYGLQCIYPTLHVQQLPFNLMPLGFWKSLGPKPLHRGGVKLIRYYYR